MYIHVPTYVDALGSLHDAMYVDIPVDTSHKWRKGELRDWLLSVLGPHGASPMPPSRPWKLVWGKSSVCSCTIQPGRLLASDLQRHGYWMTLAPGAA